MGYPSWSMPTWAQAWVELGGRGQGCSSGGVKHKELLLPSDLPYTGLPLTMQCF